MSPNFVRTETVSPANIPSNHTHHCSQEPVASQRDDPLPCCSKQDTVCRLLHNRRVYTRFAPLPGGSKAPIGPRTFFSQTHILLPSYWIATGMQKRRVSRFRHVWGKRR